MGDYPDNSEIARKAAGIRIGDGRCQRMAINGISTNAGIGSINVDIRPKIKPQGKMETSLEYAHDRREETGRFLEEMAWIEGPQIDAMATFVSIS